MKPSTFRFHARLLICLSAATFHLPALHGERHCPGNVASVTPRLVAHTLIVIPVKVNQQGPFDFMVDTGSQVTVIDPSLAAELSLKPQAQVGLVTAASREDASISVLESLEAGFQTVHHPLAIVHDLGQVKAADPGIRGVLGEDFLAHFDMLIDYGHKLLCLDGTGSMRAQVSGEQVSFVGPENSEEALPFARRLVLAVDLPGGGSRPLLLQLDSGTNSPFLYQNGGKNRLALLDQAMLRAGAGNAVQREFAALPPQRLRVGAHTVRQISFITPVATAPDMPDRQEDGLLPTVLFHRVFICAAGRYVIFDPSMPAESQRLAPAPAGSTAFHGGF
jgi:hypothetical protein